MNSNDHFLPEITFFLVYSLKLTIQGRDPSPDAMCDFYDPPQYHISIAAPNEDPTSYLDSDVQTDTEKLEAK